MRSFVTYQNIIEFTKIKGYTFIYIREIIYNKLFRVSLPFNIVFFILKLTSSVLRSSPAIKIFPGLILVLNVLTIGAIIIDIIDKEKKLNISSFSKTLPVNPRIITVSKFLSIASIIILPSLLFAVLYYTIEYTDVDLQIKSAVLVKQLF